MENKGCEYCNYCKHFKDRFILSAVRGVCSEYARDHDIHIPAYPEFYNRACSNFSYSPIHNAFGISSPSEVKDWCDTYQLRWHLNYDIKMQQGKLI